MYPLNMTLQGVHTGHAVANDQAEHQALSDAGYQPAFVCDDAGAEDGLTVDALRARLDAASIPYDKRYGVERLLSLLPQ